MSSNPADRPQLPAPREPEPRHEVVPRSPLPPLDVEGTYWCSWDCTSIQGKTLVLRCHGGADLDADAVAGKTLGVVGYLVHVCPLADPETGEIRDCLRTVLVLDDGLTVGFVSAGVVKSLRLIVSLFPETPWTPPLPIQVVRQRTRQGRTTLLLQLDIGQLPPMPTLADAAGKRKGGPK